MSDVEAAAAEVPAEVESMDGIESEEEAHNADRPARSSLSKKSPAKGKPLDEFELGQSIMAKVKTLTSYGAFMDIGAATDGLLHISNLSSGFCSDVKDYLTDGQEIEVRIMNIDAAKNQIGLTLLTAEEEEAAKQPRQRAAGGGAAEVAVGMTVPLPRPWSVRDTILPNSLREPLPVLLISVASCDLMLPN